MCTRCDICLIAELFADGKAPLPLLSKLDLVFSLTQVRTLATVIRHLPQLQILKLNNSNEDFDSSLFDDFFLPYFSVFLLPSLTELECYIGNHCRRIPTSYLSRIAKLKHLQKLSIITNEEFFPLFQEQNNFPALQEIGHLQVDINSLDFQNFLKNSKSLEFVWVKGAREKEIGGLLEMEARSGK